MGLEPSCLLTLRDEWVELLRTDAARDVARSSFLLEEFLLRERARGLELRFSAGPRRALLHGHCHQKAMVGTAPTVAALAWAGYEVSEVDSGCCGMAGSFGFEKEHYDISVTLGGRRLAPAVAGRGGGYGGGRARHLVPPADRASRPGQARAASRPALARFPRHLRAIDFLLEESIMPLSRQTLESLYQTMVRIRRFDERTVELFNSGQVMGTAHSYVGQEAVAAGACAHLTKDDSVISNHRGPRPLHRQGARLDLMMAELMGREDGYCRGLGGSMHIAALDLNMLGANGIVAAGVPIGAGAALANKLRKADRVVISFFGDGGANQGVVHETMNLAAVWKLPFIFVCENNKYAL